MAPKNTCQGKHREFGNFVKTQRIFFTQIVNSLILKLRDEMIYDVKFFNFVVETV